MTNVLSLAAAVTTKLRTGNLLGARWRTALKCAPRNDARVST